VQKVGGRRFGGFFFKSEMHAFMPAVLLRMAWLDPFNANAQAQPPERQCGAAQFFAGKRLAFFVEG
jgi:hypothetical protein